MKLRLEQNNRGEVRIAREDAPDVWTPVSESYRDKETAQAALDALLGEATWTPIDGSVKGDVAVPVPPVKTRARR